MEKLLHELENLGFDIMPDEIQNVSDLVKQWQESQEKLIYEAVLAVFVLVCGLLVAYYQRKVWMLENRDFLDFIAQFDEV